MADEFQDPPWDDPLDVAATIENTPAHGTIKGMFFHDFLGQLKEKGITGPGRSRYVAFKDYPMREYVEVASQAAPLIFPDDSPRQAMRKMGLVVYPNFKASMIGKAIFAVAGRDFKRTLELASRAYKVAASHGQVTLHHLEPGHSVAELREVFTFADSFQVGIWEGGLEATGHTGHIKIKKHSLSDVDLDIHWQPR